MKIAISIALCCLLFSCSNGAKEGKNKISSNYPNSNIKRVSELSDEQQSAFDALNAIQVGTDIKNILYSTFANIYRPCYPADTSMIMIQSELLRVMKILVSDHCTSLTVNLQDELAEASVKAQDEYQVLHCSGNPGNENYGNGIPMTGRWIIPNVLGRVDVVIDWPQ